MGSCAFCLLGGLRPDFMHGFPTVEEIHVSVTTSTCHMHFFPLFSGPLKRTKAFEEVRVPVTQKGALPGSLSRVGSGEGSMGFSALGRMTGLGDNLGMQECQ